MLELTSEQRRKRFAVAATILDIMRTKGAPTYADLIDQLAAADPAGTYAERTANVERLLHRAVAQVHGVDASFVAQVLHEVAARSN